MSRLDQTSISFYNMIKNALKAIDRTIDVIRNDDGVPIRFIVSGVVA